MHDLVGGRYRLDERIGSGGMAEVWRATDARTGRTVAVKRLHPGLAHDPSSRARFRREVEAARAVSHPSAVGILDAGDGPDGAWLAMDYLAGGSLADRLRGGAMAPETVTSIGADIAGALAAVHAAGLVHRDVKPSNILLDVDGRARLADFGIARGEATEVLEDVTAAGDVVGTLRFLPPEVLEGGAATPASDVWALGAVLYEAVSGRPPFDASSPASLVASQRSMPGLPTHDPLLSGQLLAMLDADPAARPTAAEAARALAGTASGVDHSQDRTVVIPAPARRVAPARAIAVEPVEPTPVARPPAPDVDPTGRRLAPAAILVALLLAVGVLAAVNGPFASTGTAGTSSPMTGADAIATAGTSPGVPVSPTPTPSASAGGASAAPAVTGGKGKGKGKPDKPGKGKGG
ncbi:MAG TPA: serine/threonine-protein kinase [Candidatus Limnocylindrales bacterium]|jgi:hypothetical protein